MSSASSYSDYSESLPSLPGSAVRAVWRRDLFWIVTLALALRLIFVLTTPLNIEGGDTRLLFDVGAQLLGSSGPAAPPMPPLYPLYVGLIQATAGNAALEATRLLNVALGALTVACVYAIGALYFGQRAAQIAALIMAIHPIFIIETGNILTESLFLPLMFGALATYAYFTRRDSPSPDAPPPALWRGMALVGVLLGLATLTRAVTLALPAVFALHLLLRYRGRGLRLALTLGTVYFLTLSTWSVYSLARWGVFMLAGQGIAANIFIGATDGWCGPECIDQRAGIDPADQGAKNQEKYMQGALATITADPLGYLGRRVSNLLEAALQPHNTVFFKGESLKALFATWWASDRSMAGLGRLVGGDAFFPKLALYLFHFGALILGAAGVTVGILKQRNMGQALPVYGTLAYFYALHLVFTAIPRYLLPAVPLWVLFTGLALAAWRPRAANSAPQDTRDARP